MSTQKEKPRDEERPKRHWHALSADEALRIGTPQRNEGCPRTRHAHASSHQGRRSAGAEHRSMSRSASGSFGARSSIYSWRGGNALALAHPSDSAVCFRVVLLNASSAPSKRGGRSGPSKALRKLSATRRA